MYLTSVHSSVSKRPSSGKKENNGIAIWDPVNNQAAVEGETWAFHRAELAGIRIFVCCHSLTPNL